MKPSFPFILIALAFLAVPGAGRADIIRFRADLDGAQEVPPKVTPATGVAEFLYDTEINEILSGALTFSGLSAPETAAHIHGPAPVGVNAGVLIPLPLGSPVDLSGIKFTDPQETALLADQTYFNVHTTMFPGGEIRGQILFQQVEIPEPSTFGLLLAGGAALAATRFLRRRAKAAAG